MNFEGLGASFPHIYCFPATSCECSARTATFRLFFSVQRLLRFREERVKLLYWRADVDDHCPTSNVDNEEPILFSLNTTDRKERSIVAGRIEGNVGLASIGPRAAIQRRRDYCQVYATFREFGFHALG
jgi:hypothetical protein